MHDPEGFWARVRVTPSCWLWQGGKVGSAGYGRLYFGGEGHRAHRVSYELCNGPIPEGLIVRHKCDNPPCVNPDHLEVGTHQDNSDDKVSRGRHAYGERCRTPLSDEQVSEIRASTETQVVLAKRYGVTQPAISHIINGKRRNHP